MDIYLSVNNRAEVLRLPVLPPEFTVSKGRNNEVFDTVSQGQLKLIITIHGMWCLGITQIYIDKCISDILSDILEKCGGGYNFDMTPNGIRIYKYGVLQEIVKIDKKDGDVKACAKNKLSELYKVKESFSIETIEAVNSYTRAGALITVDDVNYLIKSTDHSIKNGVHYVKLGLRKFG